MTIPAWRQLLRGARQREGRSASARWVQLATVSAGGEPRVRTLVFRGWAGDEQLDLYSDSRSSKADELNVQPSVEVCWLLPKARHQYRLRGIIETLSVDEAPEQTRRAWNSLTDTGRCLWHWPHPGQPFDADAPFPQTVDGAQPPPPHFLVLRLNLQRVELLDLSHHPHRRTLWCREDAWRSQRLNP